MTSTRQRLLRTTRRQMLRNIVRVGRSRCPQTVEAEPSDDEDSTDTASATSSGEGDQDDAVENWVDWIRRATGVAEARARKYRVSDWVQTQTIRLWRWAGHLLRREDDRWSKQALEWKPVGSRKPGHPKRRWEDAINDFMFDKMNCQKGEWVIFTHDRVEWEAMAKAFAEHTA